MKPGKIIQYSLIFSFSLLFLLVSLAGAQNMQEIKSRMLNRKPTIDALKNKGMIGEGVDGYLHVRNSSPDAQNAVNAENADRRTVNEVIAKKEGAPVDKVSRTLAQKLIQGTSPGQWVMKADGTWKQK